MIKSIFKIEHLLRHLSVYLYAVVILLSQATAQILKPGTKMPELTINDVTNYSSSSLKLSEFNSKLVILDFWSTGCLACIAAFPKLDSLQKKFKGEIQIVLVNKESKDSTERFFKKRNKIKLPDIPMITGDKQLSTFFPGLSYPYQAWIDRDGTIAYFTEAYNATPKNITDYLNGKRNVLKNRTFYTRRSGSLFSIENNDWERKIPYYSYISHCDRSMNVGNLNKVKINQGESVRISENCASITDLYIRAYSENGKYNFARKGTLQVEIEDSFKYFNPSDDNLIDMWRDNFSYSYDLVVPKDRVGKIFTIMQQDLDRFFDIQANVVIKNTRSLILSSAPDQIVKRKGFLLTGEYSPDSVIMFSNQDIGKLSEWLGAWLEYLVAPFFTEIINTNKVDVIIRKKVIASGNIDELKKDLNLSGLDIVIDYRPVPILIIRPNQLAQVQVSP